MKIRRITPLLVPVICFSAFMHAPPSEASTRIVPIPRAPVSTPSPKRQAHIRALIHEHQALYRVLTPKAIARQRVIEAELRGLFGPAPIAPHKGPTAR